MGNYLYGSTPPASTLSTRRYGYIPDIYDHRDHIITFKKTSKTITEHRIEMPPVRNQGTLGACTAFAVTASYEHCAIKENLTDFAPSQLYVYWNERSLSGTTDSDSGSSIRNSIKTAAKFGVAANTLWPYITNKYTVKPPLTCYQFGARHKVLAYYKLQKNVEQIKKAISLEHTVNFGFTVTESFETTGADGIMPAPSRKVLGGHAVVICGYDDAKRQFTIQNSWGKDWGDRGFFYMPYDFAVSKYCSDFWMITFIQNESVHRGPQENHPV